MRHYSNSSTVEPLYCRRLWDSLIKGGVLISEVVCTLLYVAGTMHSVLIKGGVLISEVVCTLLYVAGTMHSVLIKGGVLISEVVCTLLYVAGTMHSVLIKGGVLISGVACAFLYNSLAGIIGGILILCVCIYTKLATDSYS